MKILEIIKEIEGRKKIGDMTRKRVTCAHCGNTWIEIIGLIVTQKEGSEDICLRVGIESENCQTCRFRPLECQECGSKDVYDIRFAEQISEEVPLSFKGIKKVTRSSDAKTS